MLNHITRRHFNQSLAAISLYGATQNSHIVAAQEKPDASVAKARQRTAPPWLSSVIVVAIFVMLCVTINFRAFSEMREEVSQHDRLAAQIQNLMDENVALQEEIHTLKSDPNVIGREAKRIGIGVKNQ